MEAFSFPRRGDLIFARSEAELEAWEGKEVSLLYNEPQHAT
jgi:hypothetical protein